MTRAALSNVKTVGGLLPSELLERVAAGDPSVPGLTPADYDLAPHETLRDAANRAWSRLTGLWRGFVALRAQAPNGLVSAGDARQRWLLPLFSELGYGRLPRAERADLTVDGRHYAISHRWQTTPIHLLGPDTDLDTRARGVAGAAAASPHGLVQDYLNKRTGDVWGFVSNGLTLRILRDHERLSRQAYVELDLEGIFEGDRFSEFFLLWLLCHESRVRPQLPAAAEPAADETDDLADDDDEAQPAPTTAPTADARPWLERWVALARDQGIRALDQLRDGVGRAIEALGRGLLVHRDNTHLRKRLRAEPDVAPLDKQDYYRQLLRLAYRLIFIFAAEDRDLLLDPAAPAAARERYLAWYGTRPLRDRALRRRGGPHPDLWRRLRFVMSRLDRGCPELGLPALGSFLWSPDACPDLMAVECDNASVLEALRCLGEVADARGNRYPVSYRNIGADELGSVYESLLELHPELDPEGGDGAFRLATAGGHDRKTSGSYYTPDALVQSLLDSALDPVLAEAERGPDPAAAILGLKICDPACGSGHFLVAAAHRLAHRLARVRSGDAEPSPEHVRRALRDVVGRCLFGVDINPMAVELCKVSLWLEALEPGRPLSFLDGHIRCGNSLLGATPALLSRGIPDAAFAALEGDDKRIVSDLKKRNKGEHNRRSGGTEQFWLLGERAAAYNPLPSQAARVEAMPDDTVEAVEKKARADAALRAAAASKRRVCDAWCAAFVWPKDRSEVGKLAPTEATLTALEAGRPVDPAFLTELDRLAADYQLFHWHLAFPQVFTESEGPLRDDDTTGWTGGFDAILGNPPWERIKLQEKEFFASRHEAIATASNAAARKRAIVALETEDPTLWSEWQAALRRADGESHLVRNSGRFPLCGRGDINTFSVFAEVNRALIHGEGRVGVIIPSSIATDATTQYFFRDLMERGCLASFISFWEIRRIFPGTDSRQSFALVTLTGVSAAAEVADLLFDARGFDDLKDPNRHFTLSGRDIALINPNTGTCPIFRSQRDAEITKAIYRRVPVLWAETEPEENLWRMGFLRMLDMANDSGSFVTAGQLAGTDARLEDNIWVTSTGRLLPLYEAKMAHHYDHRFGDYADKPPTSQSTALPNVPADRLARADYVIQPRYWVPESEVEARLEGRWPHGWLLGWRDICRATDARTVIASVIPRVAVNDKFLLMLPGMEPRHALVAALQSFVFDYVSRQKVGGTSLKYFTMKQLPMLPPSAFLVDLPWLGSDASTWIRPRVLELTYTAWDLEAYGRDLGHAGPPFRWDEGRRHLLRCELDAAFFHLYGVPRDDAAYILDTFPIVKRKDEKEHGHYRTKSQILTLYDAMQTAMTTGHPYQTPLTPPPAHPTLCHPPRRAAALAPMRYDLAALAALPDGEWASTSSSESDLAVMLALAAVLKASGGQRPKQWVTLAVALVLNPRVATSSLSGSERTQWLRLVGREAAPLGAGIASLLPHRFPAWSEAVRQLRATDLLIETHAPVRWAPGPGLAEFETVGWPDGRAAMIVQLLESRDTVEVIDAIPEELRRWMDAA